MSNLDSPHFETVEKPFDDYRDGAKVEARPAFVDGLKIDTPESPDSDQEGIISTLNMIQVQREPSGSPTMENPFLLNRTRALTQEATTNNASTFIGKTMHKNSPEPEREERGSSFWGAIFGCCR
ncbi:hypothetical protein Moror_4926 [Moniliophthora roreri MCA 2997]|uniref:Uncharacterized protein n=1 Tax=Moniliophthora roreri (strain MCA 2997) TaxID=1381753 RepID=V2WHW6_MONRO|nr:hypothetical protein Moror_4926 [Moniliophthora roreri MCA 2997]KAI3603310.1 hypothetical protein WG66_002316 [Moniliophthora roreri]